MTEKKSITTLIKQCTEEEYRNLPGINYSKISSYIKVGPRSIINDIFTPSDGSILGTIVDYILTNGKEAVNSKYYVADIKSLSDKTESILLDVYSKLGRHKDLWDNSKIQEILKTNEYYPNYKDETRLNKFLTEVDNYFTSVAVAEGKEIIPTEFFNTALACVEAIQEAPFSEILHLKPDVKVEDVEVLKQASFVYYDLSLDSDIKIRVDQLNVDHKNKTIRILDYKLSSEEEIHFIKAVYKFNYNVQAELYKFVLESIIKDDPYFSDFKILPFTFIVVNKENKTPIAWEYPDIYSSFWKEYALKLKNNILNSQYKYTPDVLDNNCIVPLNIYVKE